MKWKIQEETIVTCNIALLQFLWPSTNMYKRGFLAQCSRNDGFVKTNEIYNWEVLKVQTLH